MQAVGLTLIAGLDVIKICQLGDSMSAQSYMFQPMWTSRLETALRQNGVDCEVVSYSINGYTFFRLNTLQTWGANTALEKAIAYAPDVIIVVCGYNDTFPKKDGRSVAQVQADALTTFSTLRTNFPNSLIVYGAQTPYDVNNFTSANLKNKGAPPGFFTFESAPSILQNTYCPDILEDAASAQVRALVDDWVAVDTYIKALSQIDGSFSMQPWGNARMGCQISDSTHATSLGHSLFCGAAMEGFKAVHNSGGFTPGSVKAFFENVSDQGQAEWNYFTSCFTGVLAQSGDGWVTSWPGTVGSPAMLTNNLNGEVFSPDAWYFPYKWQFSFYPKVLNNDNTTKGLFQWTLTNGVPNTPVEISVDEGSFQFLTRPSNNEQVVTDARGFASDFSFIGDYGLDDGEHTFRFRLAIGDGKYQATNAIAITLNPSPIVEPVTTPQVYGELNVDLG